jgi:hypothetical protein
MDIFGYPWIYPYRALFAATNFKNIKDHYSGKFAGISKKVKSGFSYFDAVLADDMSRLFS